MVAGQATQLSGRMFRLENTIVELSRLERTSIIGVEYRTIRFDGTSSPKIRKDSLDGSQNDTFGHFSAMARIVCIIL